jgi:diguanylate cyclase (GGDEF)-like protein
MVRSRFPKELATLVVLAAVYFVAGKLGLRLAYVNASATPVWPCTGIALAAFLILGYRAWPAILAGAFLVNLTTAGTFATSLGIAAGNTLEGVVGCFLVNRFAAGRQVFERAQDIFKFAFLVAMVSTTVSATVGVTTLAVAGFASWNLYGPIWLTWWLGDAVGALVFTPLVLLWWENPRLHWTRKQMMELFFLFAGLFVTGWIVFLGPFHDILKDYPLEYLCVPFLIWAAFRFGRRKAATVIAFLAAIATWGTVHGFGPFSQEFQNTSLILLQTFIGIMAITTLALAAEVTEHNRADQYVRHLAVTDSLTGLANHRRLLDALDAEIKRHDRTQRPFAVVLLDLDGLKIINDTYGHLVGTDAICRLANILRIHSRAVDTAARYGGDEFALVLPETESHAAQRVADRIAERLRTDGDEPPVTVSTGIAVYPRDGKTIEQLLAAADHALYQEKGFSKRKLPQSS